VSVGVVEVVDVPVVAGVVVVPVVPSPSTVVVVVVESPWLPRRPCAPSVAGAPCCLSEL
jgi:hypothetical protein